VRDLLRAMRPHQWVKNLLVLIPILLGHKFNEPARVLSTGQAFLAFCLAASGAYLLNDVLDLDADRNHPAKRMRPFASGSAPLWAGMLAAPILLLAAFAVALSVTPALAAVILAYCVATCAYSLKLKRVPLLDVVALASLYAVRVIGGSAATHVALSPWTIAFFMFLFLSLAMMKRYSELLALTSNGLSRVEGRGYRASDLAIIGSMGSAAGYISILTLALYVHSNDVSLLYRHPSRLWALCVVGLYGISRMWLIAHRGEMNSDPILFVLRDRVSYVLAAVAAACFVWSL
jgi:4-hydroxybenzoate polyprenyltransferase